jgi:hypothetical protein
MSWIKDSLTLLFVVVAVGSLLCLMAAAAGAQTKVGWQIHVTQKGRLFTIGPPFPTKQVCEDVRFPVMISMVQDTVECLPVADYFNKD